MSAVARGVFTPGDELDGFVIEAVAGRGGMGVVYRARQRRPDRVVALKVIAGELADDPDFRERFARESTLAAQIEHPNVIPVHAVGEAGGVLYIAMRFVDGVDLRSVIAQERVVEPRRAAAITDQVAQALDAAHARGLVHRDVKPANILLARAGGREHVYLTDFGLARMTGASHGLTQTGVFLGTVDYIAPEQARGERVDARADIYSLGCTLFQAVTGTVPFPLDSDLAKLYAHDRQAPPSALDRNPQLPSPFEAVLARAMAKAPDDRYLSAGDLGRAALAAATGQSVSRTERSVAIGTAAPDSAEAVAPREAATAAAATIAAAGTAATQTAATEMAGARTTIAPARVWRRRPAQLGAAALVLAAIVGVIVAVSSGGSSPASRARQAGGHPSRRTGGQTAAVVRRPTASGAVGFVPGRRIGVAVLGESRARVSAALVGHGYTESPGAGPHQLHFAGPRGQFVIGFAYGVVSYVQKYDDTTVSLDGVSINSTLRAAMAALPSWRVVHCHSYSRLVAPGALTYFYLGAQPNQGNTSGGNGITVQNYPSPYICF